MTTEHESIDFDVLFVGAGPASLSSALHLSNLIKDHNKEIDEGRKQGEKLDPEQITVIEKGSEAGMHTMSGAVVDPIGIKELLPDFLELGFPFEKQVSKDSVYFLSEGGSHKVPFVPATLKNDGFYVMSLYKLVRWLSDLVEANGVNIFPGFPGKELIYDGENVVGVRIGDTGIAKDGSRKPCYEPGSDLLAKITVLGEGSRGTLTKQLVEKFNLIGFNPQIYSTGIKEVWEVPGKTLTQGSVIHTMGFPLSKDTFGGGFIYSMDKDFIALGLVTGLDYKDPCTDPHNEFQKFKTHPFVKDILKGGKIAHYGAKTISEGGFYSLPQHFVDGCLVIGDSGGFLNAERLKGVHLAIKTGIMAAEVIFDSLINKDYTKNALSNFKVKFDSSWAYKELYDSRHFRSNFKKGLYSGILKSGLKIFTSGGDNPEKCLEDHENMKKLTVLKGDTDRPACVKVQFDDKLTFSKVNDVYYSGTSHEGDQPCHLLISDYSICNGKCKEEYGNPCTNFCPADVYEMVEDGETGESKLKLNPENCVHCKTCDIADPYGIITWVPPEGGGGPKYLNM